MRTTSLASAAIVALASQASAETIKVDVGPNGDFAFSPNNIKAKVGDVLSFNFHPLNHSVVMGDFSNPCAPAKTGGFFSGFKPVSSGVASQTFEVTINNTDPIFFYCAQNTFSHCISGMSGVVNEDSSSRNTLDAYQSAAQNVKSASNPDNVFGGRLVSSDSSPTSTTASPASTTSCTTSNKAPNGNGYKRDTCSGAGSVQASLGIVAAALGMAMLLS